MRNTFPSPVKVLQSSYGDSKLVQRNCAPNHLVHLFVLKCQVKLSTKASFLMLEKQSLVRQLYRRQSTVSFKKTRKCAIKVQRYERICMYLNILLMLKNLLWPLFIRHHHQIPMILVSFIIILKRYLILKYVIFLEILGSLVMIMSSHFVFLITIFGGLHHLASDISLACLLWYFRWF